MFLFDFKSRDSENKLSFNYIRGHQFSMFYQKQVLRDLILIKHGLFFY